MPPSSQQVGQNRGQQGQGQGQGPGQRQGPQGGGITMLGAAQTGKTTFLAALQIALLRRDFLGWSLVGDNQASTQAMVRFMDQMTYDHVFPEATLAQLENYRWSLRSEVTTREWRRWRFRDRTVPVTIPLDLVDAPGVAADGSKIYGRQLSQDFIARLLRSAGIVFFFDALSEVDRGDAFRFMYGVLSELRRQSGGQGRLPHYVAVCITKFDSIPIYRSAQALRVVTRNPDGEQLPEVPEGYAQGFFERLIRMSSSDDASLIPPLLRQTFAADRIRFFVTSAIGFYVDPRLGVFDPDDYQNHIPGKPDRIRGGIYPINVVEPVLWLGRNVARAAQ
jgi:hypothetical protein